MNKELCQLQLTCMKATDIPAVQMIERHSFPNPWSAQAFLAELTENECAHYLVMRRHTHVVGYVGMWIILDEGHITNVAVHPAWRRKGIGATLLTSLEKYAYAYGVRKMTLEVRVSNIGAQRLYTRLGYHKYGVRHKYYQDNHEDALIMWKELTADEYEQDQKSDIRHRDEL